MRWQLAVGGVETALLLASCAGVDLVIAGALQAPQATSLKLMLCVVLLPAAAAAGPARSAAALRAAARAASRAVGGLWRGAAGSARVRASAGMGAGLGAAQLLDGEGGEAAAPPSPTPAGMAGEEPGGTAVVGSPSGKAASAVTSPFVASALAVWQGAAGRAAQPDAAAAAQPDAAAAPRVLPAAAFGDAGDAKPQRSSATATSPRGVEHMHQAAWRAATPPPSHASPLYTSSTPKRVVSCKVHGLGDSDEAFPAAAARMGSAAAVALQSSRASVLAAVREVAAAPSPRKGLLSALGAGAVGRGCMHLIQVLRLKV
jgi:hypothetical protein